jgi:hypothetical protein
MHERDWKQLFPQTRVVFLQQAGLRSSLGLACRIHYATMWRFASDNIQLGIAERTGGRHLPSRAQSSTIQCDTWHPTGTALKHLFSCVCMLDTCTCVVGPVCKSWCSCICAFFVVSSAFNVGMRLFVKTEVTEWLTDVLHGAESLRSYQFKIPAAFYAGRTFATVFTRVTHFTLPWTRWIRSTPCHVISLRSIFNIIHPAAPRSSEWSRLRFPHQNPVVYWSCGKNFVVKNFIILGLPLKLLVIKWMGWWEDGGVCITHMPMNILPKHFVGKTQQTFWDVIPYCLLNTFVSEELAASLLRTVVFGLLGTRIEEARSLNIMRICF